MINTYYEADGTVVLEIAGSELALERVEAEELFVLLGYTLQDMDVSASLSNTETGEQPDV